jgi:hypothetical protein
MTKKGMKLMTERFQEHHDPDVGKALIRLCDELCSWERSTELESVLILRERGFVLRALSGKPNVPSDLLDLELLERIPASSTSHVNHSDNNVQKAVIELDDILSMRKRGSGRTSVLIIREISGYAHRSMNGSPVSDNVTDEQLLATVENK